MVPRTAGLQRRARGPKQSPGVSASPPPTLSCSAVSPPAITKLRQLRRDSQALTDYSRTEGDLKARCSSIKGDTDATKSRRVTLGAFLEEETYDPQDMGEMTGTKCVTCVWQGPGSWCTRQRQGRAAAPQEAPACCWVTSPPVFWEQAICRRGGGNPLKVSRWGAPA